MAISIIEYDTYRRLVAIGSSEFWYEDIDVAAGGMIKLADGLDTTRQVAMFELAQKIFVVNGTIKKVADFVNTRLTVSGLVNPPAHGDILNQGSAPNQAHMVVDYVSRDKTKIYGFAYYSGTAEAWAKASFTSNNAIATMSGSPAVTAVAAGPHWYDWEPYPDVHLTDLNVTRSYGTMPDELYLGCAYRGRAVLAGNPEAPFQWYMSRQLNPWDWAYFANDAGSPVSGGNSDAGQLGDIIRALIPYKDDYLVFGCAATTHMLAGDPASHGELRKLDGTTGIFGQNAFCWGPNYQLYFFGNNGLCRTSIPGAPVNISHTALPRLISDASADQSTHRVTMAYDSLRDGILVCITELATGAGHNFWYDLRVVDDSTVGGYFPEEYPAPCGAYAQFFYDAPDTDRRALLVGCADGYIRKFDDNAVNDELHDEDAAIESEVVFGPYSLSDQEDYEGTLDGLNAVLASNSDGMDSSPVDFEVYTDRSSESLIKKIRSGIKQIAGKFSGAGRGRGGLSGKKARGAYLGIKLKNHRKSESWGFEKLLFSLKRGGRQK